MDRIHRLKRAVRHGKPYSHQASCREAPQCIGQCFFRHGISIACTFKSYLVRVYVISVYVAAS